MNFVCGFLLLLLENEDDCFWCLAAMVQQLLPAYFAADLRGSVIDLRVFEDMVKEGVPGIAAKLTELEFDMELVSAQVYTVYHLRLAFLLSHSVVTTFLMLGVGTVADDSFCDDTSSRVCGLSMGLDILRWI